MDRFCLAGDYYVETDSTTRGITLDVSPFDYLAADETKTYREAQQIQDSQQKTEVERYSAMFIEEVEAPLVPEDPFSHLELTTIRSLDMSAAQIAISVVQLLNNCARSRIIKVSSRKFAIKAEIGFDNLLCGVKARVYRQPSGHHCVEMQRRSGDTIAFNRFYNSLSQHMQS